MKTSLLTTRDTLHRMAVGLAILVAIGPLVATTTALAQQRSQVDTQTLQQVDALVQKYDQALSNGDMSTLGSLYLPGALVITPFGKLEDGKTDFHIANRSHGIGFRETSQVEDVQPVFDGQGLLVTAAYTVTFAPDQKIPTGHGYDLFVLEKTGEEWKIRSNAASRLLPPPPPK